MDKSKYYKFLSQDISSLRGVGKKIKNLLKRKKILYRSEYRGTKEMDLLLSGFVKRYINKFGIIELKQLDHLLNFDDDNLFKWYLNKKDEIKIPNNKVSNLFKNYKI